MNLLLICTIHMCKNQSHIPPWYCRQDNVRRHTQKTSGSIRSTLDKSPPAIPCSPQDSRRLSTISPVILSPLRIVITRLPHIKFIRQIYERVDCYAPFVPKPLVSCICKSMSWAGVISDSYPYPLVPTRKDNTLITI